jgi:membrane associated rhomboid family serine protease
VKHEHFDHRIWPYALPGAFILAILWLIQWAQQLFAFPFYKLGVLPQTIEGMKGILIMPFIHDKHDLNHLLNNSLAFFILSTLLTYAYRKLALPVLLVSWLFCGSFLWLFASTHSGYHIGMSGVIYALSSFLFFSGALRRYFPLQALSLLVVFLYGSTVWGMLPLDPRISWEGHLSGFVSGLLLALYFRNTGPQRPKYQYEIEQEMGIEPPDLEGEWLKQMQAMEENKNPLIINYHFLPKQATDTTGSDAHNPPSEQSLVPRQEAPHQENQASPRPPSEA